MCSSMCDSFNAQKRRVIFYYNTSNIHLSIPVSIKLPRYTVFIGVITTTGVAATAELGEAADKHVAWT